jgi:flavin reductase (DIM6/NTAB) family NADH-FMN oxidoreductase RutF
VTGPLDDRFDQIVGELDYPMYVVTAAAGESKAGCLVGFTSQVSIDPPRFVVGLSEKNHTTRIASEATHLAVHLLTDENRNLARLFGEQTGDEVDKFAQCRWSTGPHGVPILDDAVAWFVGRIAQRFDFGDHVGHLLAPVHVEIRRPINGLLTFADVRDVDPGHNP